MERLNWMWQIVPAEMLSLVHESMIGCNIVSKSVSRRQFSSDCFRTVSHWAFSTASSICFCCCCIRTWKINEITQCESVSIWVISMHRWINYPVLCGQILFRLSNLIAKHVLLADNILDLTPYSRRIQIRDGWYRCCWWLLLLNTRHRNNRTVPIVT